MKALEAAIIVFLTSAVIAVPGGFAIMLALGVLHSHYAHIPNLNLLESILLLLAWRFVSPTNTTTNT